MKKLVLAILFILPSILSFAQGTFNHGPDDGIEASYFDPKLAPFYHGVASGDPLDDRVIIWTRVTPTEDALVDVYWFMATDTLFENVVASGKTETDYTKDYTVKVDVEGLQPGVVYYYYFSALGANSIVGRTHTLPVSQTKHLRFAVVSCANYQMGFFNGYGAIARRTDIDAVIHLGDYIYEYATHEYGWTSEVGRTHRPNNELRTLDDYRIRHSFYKLDSNLREAHRQHPFITVWDDHEVVNNSYNSGSTSSVHNDNEDGDYATRKRNAVTAYMEWLPIRNHDNVDDVKIHRKFTYGDLMELYMVDTRLEERTAQVSSMGDANFNDTTRRILGDDQREWLLNSMANSTSKWKVVGNQVMFSDLATAFKLDSWVGYPYERQLVLNGLQALNDKNLVFLTGDTHRGWTFDLTSNPFDTAVYQTGTGKGAFGIELCTPSIASPNRDESNPGTSPIPEETAEMLANPHLKYIDLDNHGYFVMDVTENRVQADFFHVDTKFASNRDDFDEGWYTFADQGYLRQATSPSQEKTGNYFPAPISVPTLDSTLSAGEIFKSADFMISGVYPNPATDHIYMGLAVNKPIQVNISFIDIQGRMVKQEAYPMDAGNHTIEVNVNGLDAGQYIVVFETDGSSLKKQIIVQ